MTQIDFNFDPSARKHGGVSTSVDAHRRVVQGKEAMWRRIMELARSRGEYGITVHEVAGAFGKTPNEVSGRLSELVHNFKCLSKTEIRSNGAYVLVVK